MNFKDFSVHEFCECVYGIGDKCSNQISTLDMYSFVNSKTNNFDLTLFEFFINDVRSFFDYIEVEVEDPQKHYDIIGGKTSLSSTGSLESAPLHYDSFTMSRKNVPKEVIVYEVLYDEIERKERTLGDKIAILSHYDFVLGFKNNIGRIEFFSDLVEQEYQKAIDLDKQNRIPVVNTIKLNDFTSREFIQHCFQYEVPELEIYEYIKLKTDNFESSKVSLFKKELFRFIDKVKIYATKEWGDGNRSYSEESKYYLFSYLESFASKNLDNPVTKEIIAEIETANVNNDLRYAFSIAQKIDPTIRITVEYYSFDCILQIIEDTFKEKNVFNSTVSNTSVKTKLSLSEMALICYYKSDLVTKENAQSILDNFNSPLLPEGIVKRYNKYLFKSNRINSGGPSQNISHKKRLLNVVRFLKENKLPHQEAEADLNKFLENIDIY